MGPEKQKLNAEMVGNYPVPAVNVYDKAVEAFHKAMPDAPDYLNVDATQRFASMESNKGRTGLNSLNKSGYGGLMAFGPYVSPDCSQMEGHKKTILQVMAAVKVDGVPAKPTLDDLRKPSVFFNPTVQILMMLAVAYDNDKYIKSREAQKKPEEQYYAPLSKTGKVALLYYMHNLPEVGKRIAENVRSYMSIKDLTLDDNIISVMKKGLNADPAHIDKINKRFAAELKMMEANPKVYGDASKSPVNLIIDFLYKTDDPLPRSKQDSAVKNTPSNHPALKNFGVSVGAPPAKAEAKPRPISQPLSP